MRKSTQGEDTSISATDISFFVVGCQRCGSTWLYEALKEHPEICLPSIKQIHYYDRNDDESLEWYLNHFSGKKPHHKAAGEVATSYCLPSNIPKLSRDFPHAKIMIAMRNPIERAYSFFKSRQPHENWKDFKEALESNKAILTRGQYCEQIEVLLNHYDKSDILFLFYYDLSSNEKHYIKQVYEFLGVNTDFVPSVIGNPVRAAMFPKTRTMLKKAGLSGLVNLVNKSWAGNVLRRLVQLTRKKRSTKKSSVKMSDETLAYLTNHFKPYNEKLSAITGRNLDHWNRL